MERYQNQYNKEYMKLAMLKQEETFRYQVQELHRLYKVQKSLMTEAKTFQVKKQGENETCSSKSSDSNPYQIRLVSEEQVRKPNIKLESDEDADLDLTLAIGSTTTRSKKKKKEASFTSDSGTSFSSSSNETEGSRLNSGTRLKSNLELAFQNERTIGFAIEGHMSRNEGLEQPPWMYQRFNLNFT
ncbi:V-type sodium ATPase catalytic subunit A [Rhynchospora pubera]|nr:V-type sodium ATPase catalytic subunit A [Rhynchospora pubera]